MFNTKTKCHEISLIRETYRKHYVVAVININKAYNISQEEFFFSWEDNDDAFEQACDKYRSLIANMW